MHNINMNSCVSFIILFISSCSKESISAVEVTPDTVSVCPGEPVTFKCTTSTTLLWWSVILNNVTLPPFELPLLTQSIMESVNEVPVANLVFRAEWTSLSPPCSTFITNASLALHNAQVKCSSAGSSDTSTIVMRGTYTLE